MVTRVNSTVKSYSTVQKNRQSQKQSNSVTTSTNRENPLASVYAQVDTIQDTGILATKLSSSKSPEMQARLVKALLSRRSQNPQQVDLALKQFFKGKTTEEIVQFQNIYSKVNQKPYSTGKMTSYSDRLAEDFELAVGLRYSQFKQWANDTSSNLPPKQTTSTNTQKATAKSPISRALELSPGYILAKQQVKLSTYAYEQVKKTEAGKKVTDYAKQGAQAAYDTGSQAAQWVLSKVGL